ncbi:MAG: DHH family phosphoesterase [Halobacteriaceae archaeon]
MDEELFGEERSIERRSLVPGEGFFVPDDIEEEREEAEARETLAAADVVVVTDDDADGLGCAAIIREAHGDAGILPSGPGDIGDALERVATYGTPELVYVCDICPDTVDRVGEPLQALLERGATVRWFDHHQWEPAVADELRDWGVELVVGESDEQCTADVALESIDHPFPARFEELAAVTRDHDLWIKKDERSDDLGDFAYWAEDIETYVETVREHGVALPEDVQAFLTERRVEKDELIDRAVDRADIRTVGPWTVGVTYGRCSQNEVAERLRVEAGADAAVIVKPSGAASIRGSEGFEQSHRVARLVGGGGHPRAAGCKPDVHCDILDYARHWVTQGAVTKQAIMSAFETVAAETESDEATHQASEASE